MFEVLSPLTAKSDIFSLKNQCRLRATNLELAKSLLEAIQTDWSPAKFDDKIISVRTSAAQQEYNVPYEY